MYKKIFTAAIFGILLGLVVPPKIWGAKEQLLPQVSGSSIVADNTPVNQPKHPVKLADVVFPEIGAKALLAIDLDSGTILYSQNKDTQLPIASLTKLMTAMVVVDNTSKDKIVNVTAADTKVIGTKMGLVDGENITVQNLLYGLLIPSSNDAAEALARSTAADVDAFVAMMNQKASRLGLTGTHFQNPVGLDDPNNYSTAADLAKLSQEFLKYSFLSNIVDTKSLDIYSTDGKIVHHLKTSNKLLEQNPEIVGVKTGNTTEALGNLIIKDIHNGHSILTIVLNTKDREGDTQKLLDWIYGSYGL